MYIYILRPNDIMPLRKKYNGELMSEVWMYDPGYIDWMMRATDQYAITVSSFLKLPNPKSVEDYFRSQRSGGSSNGGVKVSPIYHTTNQVILGRDLESKGIFIPSKKFNFSELALKNNEKKINSI